MGRGGGLTPHMSHWEDRHPLWHLSKKFLSLPNGLKEKFDPKKALLTMEVGGGELPHTQQPSAFQEQQGREGFRTPSFMGRKSRNFGFKTLPSIVEGGQPPPWETVPRRVGGDPAN